MRRYIPIFFIALFILTMVPASAQAGIEDIFPTEQEMGFNVNPDDLAYKKFPIDHYAWDTVHTWFKMEGIRPVTGDARELTSNAILDPIFAAIIAINRVVIFCLQVGFNNTLIDPILLSIDQAMQPIINYFFDNTYGFAALGLGVVIIIKLAQGRKGEGVAAVFKAVIYTALIFAFIDNITWFVDMVGGFADYISLTTLGVMSLAPLTGADAAALAGQKIVDISNAIFALYVENTWTFGQFGAISDLPVLTMDELHAINIKLENHAFFFQGQPWNEIFLQFPSGEERKFLVEALVNQDIQHDPRLNTNMLYSGSSSRSLLVLLSSAVNLCALGLYGAIGIMQFASKIGIIVLTVAFCFLVVLAFFGDLGERLLKKAIGLWLFLFFFRVAAAIYLGIPILVMTLLNMFNNGNLYVLAIFLHIIVNGAGIYFLPIIWKVITPAMIRATANTIDMIGNPKGKLQGNFSGSLKGVRTSPPRTPVESLRSRFRENTPPRRNVYRRPQDPDADKIKHMSPRQEYKFRQAKAATSKAKATGTKVSKVVEQEIKEEQTPIPTLTPSKNKMKDNQWKDFHIDLSEEMLEKSKEYNEELHSQIQQKEKEEKARERLNRARRERQLYRRLNNMGKIPSQSVLIPPRKY